MSDRPREQVEEQALVYIACPGRDCRWGGPVMVAVDTQYARKERMQCPRCGRTIELRTELDVEVQAVSGRRLPRGGVEQMPDGSVRQQGETAYQPKGSDL